MTGSLTVCPCVRSIPRTVFLKLIMQSESQRRWHMHNFVMVLKTQFHFHHVKIATAYISNVKP